jgi:rare lipoprotein A
MRQLMTSALLTLAVSAGAVLPAAANDIARESAARERSGAHRSYHHERRTERRRHQHLAYHGRWQRSEEDDVVRPHRRGSYAAVRSRHASHHFAHRHVRSAMHERRTHRIAHRATVGRRTAWHGAGGHRTVNHATANKDLNTVAPRAGGQQGMASFYSEPQRLASGGWFNPNALTAAHRSLPFGTRVRVTHRGTGRSVDVTINDRGPYIAGRIIDLSRAAANALGMTAQGVARVSVQVLGR